jgi:5-formyltetrahydrofolate cyclo-ligase
VTAQAGSTIPSTADLRQERRELRRRIRAERRALPAEVRARADKAIINIIRHLPAFRRARRVALFLTFDGEPNLIPLVRTATRQGKYIYVPVITRTRMRFAPLAPNARLRKNFYGILEPQVGRPIDTRRLDLVLTPLVAFDSRGIRMGVGKGYYDRCFRFLLGRRSWHRPKLLGIAYELQHLPELDAQPWDVPLWGAVTEHGVRHFKRG